MTDRLADLTTAGVSIWLDDLSRERLATGDLATLRSDSHIRGVTTNPTIFAKAIGEKHAYDEQIRDLASRGVSVEEAIRMLTAYDVRWACDVMRPVYDATSGLDGRVSLEVDPRLAHATTETVAEAKGLWWLVDRENLFIKIPATREGLPAITATLAEGISVNVTLIFSLDRYREVMDAFMTGLEKAKANGHDLSQIASVASFFVSRVDTEIDKRLGGDSPLAGKAAVANARLAYEAYEQTFATDRWGALAEVGARPQRPLWASTGTKNASYSDVLYVENLIAPGTVNTMPEATLTAYADHGVTAPDTITGYYADAHQVFDDLAAAGVDYDDVVAFLERDGVAKFEASWVELLTTVESQLKAAR